jgi:hypothetical protein
MTPRLESLGYVVLTAFSSSVAPWRARTVASHLTSLDGSNDSDSRWAKTANWAHCAEAGKPRLRVLTEREMNHREACQIADACGGSDKQQVLQELGTSQRS